MDAPSLLDILPHEPPMVLLSGYDPDSFDETGISAFVEITPDNPFFDHERQGVPATVATEFLAQTIGCFAGFRNWKNGRKPALGFFLGSRKFFLTADFLPVGTRYRTHCSVIFYEGELFAFQTEMEDAATGALVAEGILNVYQPADPSAILQS